MIKVDGIFNWFGPTQRVKNLYFTKTEEKKAFFFPSLWIETVLPPPRFKMLASGQELTPSASNLNKNYILAGWTNNLSNADIKTSKLLKLDES